jgi:hypothetical protein
MPDRGPSVAEPEAPFAIAVKESKSADADSPETPTDAQIGESVDPHGQTRQMMDKDMLRGLVAELVRQELKGALGEHITLKLQKLVRREIHRTLTAQIFD